MFSITLRYRLSDAGRAASLLAGGNGAEVQEVEITRHDEAWPLAVLLARIERDGSLLIDLAADPAGAGATRDATPGSSSPSGLSELPIECLPPVFNEPPALLDVLRDEIQRCQRLRAAIARSRERKGR